VNHLDPEQVELLKEIGAYLRQRRTQLALPIEEIAAKTFIRSSVLKAIEAGLADELPEPVFIQGFMRRYGDALGLDGAALASSFPVGFSLPVESDAFIQAPPQPRRSKTLPFLSLALLLLAAASGLLYFLKQRTTTPVVQKQQTVATVAVSPPATPVSLTPEAPIQVTVNLQEQSWMRVMADGKTAFEGVLAKGKQQTWTAKKQLTVRAGNAGAVLIAFNQEKPKLLGTAGDIKEVTFTPAKNSL